MGTTGPGRDQRAARMISPQRYTKPVIHDRVGEQVSPAVLRDQATLQSR